ncbi:MAG: hypothetical protein Ct9H300mP27_02890 [Chloroflexota bacterium]|nr:MAG: hypothetical protein Ct9H300mP27_02890 [Chloroflexota bacterium]
MLPCFPRCMDWNLYENWYSLRETIICNRPATLRLKSDNSVAVAHFIPRRDPCELLTLLCCCPEYGQVRLVPCNGPLILQVYIVPHRTLSVRKCALYQGLIGSQPGRRQN